MRLMPDENTVKQSISRTMIRFERSIPLPVLNLSICFYLHI